MSAGTVDAGSDGDPRHTTGEGFIARLLPDHVEVAETTADLPDSVLLGEESSVIHGALPKRRAEFVTARGCARRALRRLGYPPVPILSGPRREPLWPEGVVGSLSHCEGYRAAAVATASRSAALGIDVEIAAPLPENVAGLITVGDEPRMLGDLAGTLPNVAWDRVLFSAKESIFKVWFPLARSWLDFTECEVSLDVRDKTFSGKLLVPGPEVEGSEITELAGRWDSGAGLIFTAVYMPRTRPESTSNDTARLTYSRKEGAVS